MRLVSTISFVIFSILVLKQVDALRQFRKNQWSIMDKIIQKKISETGSSRVSAVPGLFTQNLDHFDVTNAQTFQQVRQSLKQISNINCHLHFFINTEILYQ